MVRLALLLLGAVLVVTEAKTVHTIEKRSSVCYGDLGCFRNGVPFFSLQRPISFLPQSPSLINPKFLLYTREASNASQRIRAGDVATLRSSTFSSERPTKFIVHGFVDNTYLGNWMQTMTNEFLKQGDYNVFIVDWGSGSMALYGQATANTRVVGAMIAQMITFLQNTTGARPEDMHILGHSLGAHVAGYAGERLRYLGRITGMDPAEPYFQNTDKVVRLDPSDALFVDVIHTDGASFYSTKLGFGMIQPCGHMDFYANGGHDQPGCSKNPISHFLQLGLVEGTREFVACNHMRAYHLFVESINSRCPFEAYRCASEDEFNQGKCLACSGQGCGFLGLHADQVKPSGTLNKYYLKTGNNSPLCRYHVKLDLTISASHYARQERGKMYATVTGSGGRMAETQLTTDFIYIKPGSTYTYVLTSPVELGQVRDVTFRWVHESTLLDVGSWNPLGLRHPTIYVDRVQVFSGEAHRTVNLCSNGAAVETGHSLTIGGQC